MNDFGAITKDTKVSIGFAVLLLAGFWWIGDGLTGVKHEIALLRVQVEANSKNQPFRSWVELFKTANEGRDILIPDPPRF